MSIAYWCVLAAAVLPYLTVGVAKAGGSYDNASPRKPGLYAGYRARAHAAHANGLEGFAFFAVAVLVASGGAAKTSVPLLDALAVVWIALRLVYVGLYLADLASLRSLAWIAGFAVAAAIFTMPAWHG